MKVSEIIFTDTNTRIVAFSLLPDPETARTDYACMNVLNEILYNYGQTTCLSDRYERLVTVAVEVLATPY
jgi:hypothetical protein